MPSGMCRFCRFGWPAVRYWDYSSTSGSADMYRAFHEIQTALQLAPNDAKGTGHRPAIFPACSQARCPEWNRLRFHLADPDADTVSYRTDNGHAGARENPAASNPTHALLLLPHPPPHPLSKTASPFCGSAALAPLALAFWAVRRRRHND